VVDRLASPYRFKNIDPNYPYKKAPV